MKCKYDKLLIEYAIKYKKEDLVVWAVNNNFYYDPIHCNLAAENRLPKALEAMLKDNKIKEDMSNKKIGPLLIEFYKIYRRGTSILENISHGKLTETDINDIKVMIRNGIEAYLDVKKNGTILNNNSKKIYYDLLDKYLIKKNPKY